MQSYVISENNALLSELCAGARNVASDVTAVVFGDKGCKKSALLCTVAWVCSR